MDGVFRPPSGHVFRLERKRGPSWYAKYRLPDGRQVQKKLGPAWTERGRPPAGYFTKRHAEVWLGDTLAAARRGTLPGLVRTRTTFAEAAEEWLRYVATTATASRRRSATTAPSWRRRSCPPSPSCQLEEITPQLIEDWRAGLLAQTATARRTALGTRR